MRLLAALAATGLAALAGAGATATSAPAPPACAPDTVAALKFDGLPRSRVLIGKTWRIAFREATDADADAADSVRLREFLNGRLWNTETLAWRTRESDISFGLSDHFLRIEATYLETNADGSQCARVLRRKVRAKRRIFFPSRCSNKRIRPRRAIVACGDGNLQLRKMRWRGWNRRAVRGRGRALYNDCQPNCAAGHFHSAPVRVRLFRPRRCRNIQRYVYTRLKYRISKGGPNHATVPFPCTIYH